MKEKGMNETIERKERERESERERRFVSIAK